MQGMSVSRALIAQVIALLVAALLVPPVGISQQAGGLATFLDSVEVRVVNVDVVVLDDDGRPVTGLARADFELLEDGKPVELTNFAAYEEAAAASAGEATLESGAAPAEPSEEAAPRAAPPATWIVYVDQSLLQPGPRNQVAKETRDFLAGSLQPGDRSMVATFDGLSLKLLSPLAADRAPALEALAKLEKQVGFPSGLRGRASAIQRDIMAVDLGSPNAPFEADNLLRDIESAADEMAGRSRAALDAFSDLLAIIAGIEGRVAVLYAGGGFESNPAENLYRLWQSKFRGLDGGGGPSSMRDRDPNAVQARLDYGRLLKTVNASRVTVYSIYAGEGRGPDVSAEIGGDPGTSGPSLSLNSPEGGSSLSAFATETGGRAFVGAPDLAQRLETAKRDLATYYSLGYRPEGSDPGAFHELTVRVHRDGVKVVHRRGVAERAPEEIAGDEATAALLSAAPAANPFGALLQIGAATRSKSGRAMLVPVTVRVPLRGLTLLPDGAAHRAQLSFHFSLRDPDGGYRRLEPRPLEFSVPNDKLAGSLGQSIAFSVDLTLEPGAYQLGVAVVDKLGGTSSATTSGFEVVKAR
jgi:VWFA-related protein